MKLITKGQIGAIYGLLRKHGLSDDKARIINEISGGRTGSTAALYFNEAHQWISAMTKLEEKKSDPAQRMINNIVAMAREMQVVYRQDVVNADGRVQTKSNYSRLNKWMKESSYLKKPLRDYTYEELPKLVSQYKNIYFSWLKTRS